MKVETVQALLRVGATVDDVLSLNRDGKEDLEAREELERLERAIRECGVVDVVNDPAFPRGWENVLGDEACTALEEAKSSGNEQVARVMQEAIQDFKGMTQGWSPFGVRGVFVVQEAALENSVNYEDENALLAAVCAAGTCNFPGLKHKYEDIVNMLVEAASAADLSAGFERGFDGQEFTALDAAAASGNETVARALLDAMQHRQVLSEYPLFFSMEIAIKAGSFGVLKQLIQAGNAAGIKLYYQRLFQAAIERPDDNHGKSVNMVGILLDAGMHSGIKSTNGKSLLVEAMRKYNEQVVGLLIQDNANVSDPFEDDDADDSHWTPLMHAIHLRGNPGAPEGVMEAIMRHLLDAGADINQVTKEKAPAKAFSKLENAGDYCKEWTALLFAADQGLQDVVCELLERGAHVKPYGESGTILMHLINVQPVPKQNTLNASITRSFRVLIEANWDAMFVDSGESTEMIDGRAELMRAAELGRSKLVSILLTANTIISYSPDVLTEALRKTVSRMQDAVDLPRLERSRFTQVMKALVAAGADARSLPAHFCGVPLRGGEAGQGGESGEGGEIGEGAERTPPAQLCGGPLGGGETVEGGSSEPRDQAGGSSEPRDQGGVVGISVCVEVIRIMIEAAPCLLQCRLAHVNEEGKTLRSVAGEEVCKMLDSKYPSLLLVSGALHQPPPPDPPGKNLAPLPATAHSSPPSALEEAQGEHAGEGELDAVQEEGEGDGEGEEEEEGVRGEGEGEGDAQRQGQGEERAEEVGRVVGVGGAGSWGATSGPETSVEAEGSTECATDASRGGAVPPEAGPSPCGEGALHPALPFDAGAFARGGGGEGEGAPEVGPSPETTPPGQGLLGLLKAPANKPSVANTPPRSCEHAAVPLKSIPAASARTTRARPARSTQPTRTAETPARGTSAHLRAGPVAGGATGRGDQPAVKAPLSSAAFFPLEQLQAQPYPEGVDAATREVYLSAQDFQTAFGMTKQKFEGTQKWKRDDLKRKLKLF